MYYTLYYTFNYKIIYFYNKLRKRKENVIEKIVNTFTVLYVFLERNLPINGPAQFKCIQFKGQLTIILQWLTKYHFYCAMHVKCTILFQGHW